MKNMSTQQRVTVSKAAKSKAIRSALSSKTVRVTSSNISGRSETQGSIKK